MTSVAERLLAQDKTRIGVVYDHYAAGKSHEEIAVSIG
jgi:hypothetical protein